MWCSHHPGLCQFILNQVRLHQPNPYHYLFLRPADLILSRFRQQVSQLLQMYIMSRYRWKLAILKVPRKFSPSDIAVYIFQRYDSTTLKNKYKFPRIRRKNVNLWIGLVTLERFYYQAATWFIIFFLKKIFDIAFIPSFLVSEMHITLDSNTERRS